MVNYKIYSFVVKLWSAIFLLVGLFFLLIPETLELYLNNLVEIIGLDGRISLYTENLWYALSLSLMAALTIIAALSAQFPQQKFLFITIIVAKLVSVASFIYSAFTLESAWLVCAFADLFVAITLFVAYPKEKKSVFKSGFARQMFLNKPFYEVWFGKIDIEPNKAFWFRYTILNGKEKEASTWAILFDKNNVKTGKETYPLETLSLANEIIVPDETNINRFKNISEVFHLGKHHLDESNAIGYAGNISWDLKFSDSGLRFEHVPPFVKLLGVAKSIYNACFLDLKFSGTIIYNNEKINLDDRSGMIGHIYGKKSAHAWAWAHCNNFDNAQNVIFEGLSAQIEIGGKISPPLTSFVFIRNNEKISFSSTIHLFKNDSNFTDGKWEFEAKNKKYTLKGIALATGKVALVEYTDTDGSKLWCNNSKIASLKLTLINNNTNTEEVFDSKITTAFEIVNRIKPPSLIDL